MTQSLTERLQERLAHQSAEIEILTSAELKRLASNLKIECDRELSTMRTAISGQSAQTTTLLRVLLRWPLWTALGCLTTVMACLAFLWAGTWWMRSDLTALKQSVRSEREALSELQSQTGQLRLWTATNGLFVILPDGTDLRTTYTCNNQTCLKLPE